MALLLKVMILRKLESRKNNYGTKDDKFYSR